MNDPPVISVREAATRLGVSHDTITRLIARGELIGYRQTMRRNSRVMVYTDSVERYDRQRKQQDTTP